ncbi:MAG: hypothetical protein AB7S38_27070 [Vulcanimicrobiota bacterium]
MDFLPVLSESAQAFWRTSYGLLLFLTLLLTWPASKWFFRSEKWGGYAESSPTVDLVQNPFIHPLVMGLWFTCATMLMLGRDTVLFALINLGLCWYFFIYMRWRGILRGMGAPGFMCYWMGAAVLFLEAGRHLDPSGRLLAAGLFAFQVDYAIIQLCAGSYKLRAGYPRNEGMQLGMANPWWGYYWRFFKQLDYTHPLYVFLNQSAYLTQIGAAFLMLYPPTRLLGAGIIMASFVFILTQIRLGVLCEMVIIGGLLFIPAGGVVDGWVTWLMGHPQVPQSLPQMPPWLATGLAAFFCVYIALLPFAKFGQWYNYLAHQRLPEPFQTFLEKWTNAFGIIIWRVFSVDVVNFFVRVYQVDGDGREQEYTCFGKIDWPTRWRYIHVGEFVCFASIFTTLKYHPSNSEMFRAKLVRYARTIPCPSGGKLRFAYFSLARGQGEIEHRHSADFLVEPHSGHLEVRQYDDLDLSKGHAVSPVREGARPGTYAPA